MTSVDNRDDRHAALASRTRRDVLRFLTESSEPLDASQVASQFDLHITTARFHLEQLEKVGFVRRIQQRSGGRGRPRILFTPTHALETDDVLKQLTGALAGALADDPDGGAARARSAGERWSYSLNQEHSPAASTQSSTTSLLRALNRLGFQPELRQEDREQVIALLGCPFRDMAQGYPSVICSAHRGLLEGTLEQLGHSASEASLHPFVESELCLVRLHGALAKEAARPS